MTDRRSQETAVPAEPVRIGLALGGGAVRGAAHIGVLSVLDEVGLAPAVVTGTSAGALVGALYAAGHGPAENSTLARSLRWPRLIRPAGTRRALFETSRLATLLTKVLGSRRFPGCAQGAEAAGRAVFLPDQHRWQAIAATTPASRWI